MFEKLKVKIAQVLIGKDFVVIDERRLLPIPVKKPDPIITQTAAAKTSEVSVTPADYCLGVLLDMPENQFTDKAKRAETLKEAREFADAMRPMEMFWIAMNKELSKRNAEFGGVNALLRCSREIMDLAVEKSSKKLEDGETTQAEHDDMVRLNEEYKKKGLNVNEKDRDAISDLIRDKSAAKSYPYLVKERAFEKFHLDRFYRLNSQAQREGKHISYDGSAS